MKILHYTLGLPPKRSGGLTRYAIDLMKEESLNNEVFHLFPGDIDLINRKTRIKNSRMLLGNIKHYELINSLPLPLFNGIKEPNDFMKIVPMNVYLDFLQQIKPDIIHIHTLMGIHKEFLMSAKDLGIKLVFTTHDYFGICPKINLFKENENINCETNENGYGCVNCCLNAMDTSVLLLTQTPIYPILKKINTFKKNIFSSNTIINNDNDENDILANKFEVLREYYLNMLRCIDFFHFNSTLTEQVFIKYLPNAKGKVIEITHADIKKKTNKLKAKMGKIRLGYIGPFKEYKGIFFLLDALKNIPEDKFEVHLFGDNSPLNVDSNTVLHGSFNPNELETIFSKIDVLVVPSLWRETFGFTVLESLSYGTPVIVSDNVGSKDLVRDDFGWIYSSNRIDNLCKILINIDIESIESKHKNISKYFKTKNMGIHYGELIDNIYS